MGCRHKLQLIICCCILVLLAGCKKSEDPVAPATEDWTVAVTVGTYDEFGRSAPSTGAMELTLSAKDRTLHAMLQNGMTTYTFGALPWQKYLLTVQKEGYYTAQSASLSWTEYYGTINIQVGLHPLPGPLHRIDSIRCVLNTMVPQVYLRLFAPQMLPADGSRRAVIFAGLSPDVSMRYGTYVSAIETYQSRGTLYFQTNDVYGNLREAGIVPGTKVYLTARVMTGGTTSWRDGATGLTLYANLEENTRALTSFVMP